jgi:putative transposase
MTVEFKGSHFERDIILWGVCWYVAYPISYRQIEEMMGERGVEVVHSTLNRWVLKYVPALEKAFLARKRPVGRSWRLDETYVRVKSAWKYSPSCSNRHHGNIAVATSLLYRTVLE